MNYDNIALKIANNQPFKHNSNFTGEFDRIHCPRCNDTKEYYTIYSYTTLIYSECLTCGNQWFNPEKYSVTTTRQINMIKKVKNYIEPKKTKSIYKK